MAPISCSNPPVPPPAGVRSEPALGQATSERLSKISANAEAAESASEKIDQEVVRISVQGPISVIRSLSGPASDKDRAEAMALVVKAQAGKLNEAQIGWNTAKSQANALNARIQALESEVKAQKVQAANDLKAQLDKVRQEAEAEQRRLIGYIFYGGGAFLLILSLVAASVATSMPFLGPNAVKGLGLAAMGLLATGLGMNYLLSHPWIIWVGLIVTGIAFFGACGLMWSNFKHHQETLK